MSSREYVRWVAYYSLHPFGDRAADWRAAMLASTMATLWSKGRTFPLSEFMPGSRPAKPEGSSPAELKAYFAALAAT